MLVELVLGNRPVRLRCIPPLEEEYGDNETTPGPPPDTADGPGDDLSGAPNTSDPHPEHRIYPYLLRGMADKRSNQVWCTDITYIPVQHGFLYLVAIMDWATRYVLARRLSNTMDTRFCLEALHEALSCS